MNNNKRVIEFSEGEILSGLNHIELEEYGDFRAEYIVPNERKIVGWFDATEEAIEELREDGEITGEVEVPFRAAIYYIPLSCDLECEERLINDEEATLEIVP